VNAVNPPFRPKGGHAKARGSTAVARDSTAVARGAYLSFGCAARKFAARSAAFARTLKKYSG
jgi:hypothetical protein